MAPPCPLGNAKRAHAPLPPVTIPLQTGHQPCWKCWPPRCYATNEPAAAAYLPLVLGLPMAAALVEPAPELALEVDVFAAAGGDGGGSTCLPWLLVMVGGLGTGLMAMPLEKVAGLPLPATILTVGDTSMNAGDTCSAPGTHW